jgi:hypothetical protein
MEQYYQTLDSANHLINNVLSYKRNNGNAISPLVFKESSIISAEIDGKTFIIQGNEAKFNIALFFEQKVTEADSNQSEVVEPAGYRNYRITVVLDENNQYLIKSAQLILSPIANDY